MEAAMVNAVEQRLDRIEAILPELEKTLLEMQVGDLGISVKINAFDLLTQADLAAEKCLIACIRQNFPEDGIVTEEGGATAAEAARALGFAGFWIRLTARVITRMAFRFGTVRSACCTLRASRWDR